jgi:phosphoesterase RecJ-like protein
VVLKNFEYPDIRDLLGRSQRIVITSHHNADGDAIGSALALYHFLFPLCQELMVTVPNEFPGFLKWLKGSDEIIIYEKEARNVNHALAKADLVFCLDYNTLKRTGAMVENIRSSPAKRILIDHHPDPRLDEFDYYLSVVKISSTAELIYQFVKGVYPAKSLDLDLAESLFVGIMTDTGSFSYACNYPETFTIAAELIRAGVDAERVHRLVYDTYSEKRLRLLGYAISQKMVLLPELKTAYIALTKKELESFDYQVGDTEGVVNYALSVDGVMVAVLLTERKDRIRVSFRSKGNFAVNRMAREHFKGGGHMNAAGGDSFENMEGTIGKLKKVLQQYKEEIDRSTY